MLLFFLFLQGALRANTQIFLCVHRANTHCATLVCMHRANTYCDTLIFVQPFARGVLVCMQREFLSRDLCSCAQEACRCAQRESLSQDLCLCPREACWCAQREFVARSLFVRARGKLVRAERVLVASRPKQAQYPSEADWSSSSCKWLIKHTFVRACLYFYGVTTTTNEFLAR